jgi:hypothetical protein
VPQLSPRQNAAIVARQGLPLPSQQSAEPCYLQFEFALFISQYLSHFEMLFFLQVSMHFSIEHAFVWGCAAETLAVVPISASTAINAEIRSIRDPPIIVAKVSISARTKTTIKVRVINRMYWS